MTRYTAVTGKSEGLLDKILDNQPLPFDMIRTSQPQRSPTKTEPSAPTYFSSTCEVPKQESQSDDHVCVPSIIAAPLDPVTLATESARGLTNLATFFSTLYPFTSEFSLHIRQEILLKCWPRLFTLSLVQCSVVIRTTCKDMCLAGRSRARPNVCGNLIVNHLALAQGLPVQSRVHSIVRVMERVEALALTREEFFLCQAIVFCSTAEPTPAQQSLLRLTNESLREFVNQNYPKDKSRLADLISAISILQDVHSTSLFELCLRYNFGSLANFEKYLKTSVLYC